MQGATGTEASQSGPCKAAVNETGKVEMRPRTGRGEMKILFISPLEGHDFGHEYGPDLVDLRADRRADGGIDRCPAGALALHFGDRRLQDTPDGATPARVRGGDDTGFDVGKEDRRAIGGQNADREARGLLTTASALGSAPRSAGAVTVCAYAPCT